MESMEVRSDSGTDGMVYRGSEGDEDDIIRDTRGYDKYR